MLFSHFSKNGRFGLRFTIISHIFQACLFQDHACRTFNESLNETAYSIKILTPFIGAHVKKYHLDWI